MNLDTIRRLYAANDALHLKLWTCIDHLSDALFVREVPYGIGSVRNHVVHLASVDQRWMARVTGMALPERLRPDDYPTKVTVRAAWDDARARVRATVAALSDADLTRAVTYEVQRLDPPQTMSATSAVWQVLVHVLNHGTDHRAQVLRLLYEFGAPTFEQDLMVYWWDEAG